MSEPGEKGEESLVAVARAVRTRGLKGEIVADLLTDFPERFAERKTFIAVAPDGQRLTIDLEDHWFQKGRVVLKLRGFDNIESSSKLIGYEIAVPEAERVELEPDSFYEWELEGCKVVDVEGKQIGHVTGLLRTGGVEVLVVRDDKHEYLVPMAQAIVVAIDIAKQKIVIDPPEGLLDL
jgi:16S rRNA processing protein RimM